MNDISRAMECPRCKGAAPLLSPMKITDRRNAVYGCKACGFGFKADGGAYVENPEQLKDYFRAGSLGNKTLMEALAGEQLNPATKIVLQARLVEYGTQMWFDGLKQGLVMGAATAQELERLARDVLDSSNTGAIAALRHFLNPSKEKTS